MERYALRIAKLALNTIEKHTKFYLQESMGGSGGGGYGGGGYGGGGGTNPCSISLSTSISGPDAEVVPTIQTGNILAVFLDDNAGNPIVKVMAPNGQVLGSLAGIPNLRTLIECLQDGEDYVFVVGAINGGRVEGRLRNA